MRKKGLIQIRMSFKRFLFVTNFKFFHSNYHLLDKKQVTTAIMETITMKSKKYIIPMGRVYNH